MSRAARIARTRSQRNHSIERGSRSAANAACQCDCGGSRVLSARVAEGMVARIVSRDHPSIGCRPTLLRRAGGREHPDRRDLDPLTTHRRGHGAAAQWSIRRWPSWCRSTCCRCAGAARRGSATASNRSRRTTATCWPQRAGHFDLVAAVLREFRLATVEDVGRAAHRHAAGTAAARCARRRARLSSSPGAPLVVAAAPLVEPCFPKWNQTTPKPCARWSA